jgi:isopentenyl phosphate kinase
VKKQSPEWVLEFLKLGGSLITEKDRPHTPRLEVLDRLAGEIAEALSRNTNLRLILGHGSGSFGHVPARRFGTRAGVHSPEEWKGFIEVWREAIALNQLVMEALQRAGLSALAFSPLSSVTAEDGVLCSWNLEPIQAALQAGLLPVVYGDVVFDLHRGGTILSTEDLFAHLARKLQPQRILLAGLERGVWLDFPVNSVLAAEITPENAGLMQLGLGGSAAPDVTGGMASKVQQSLALVQEVDGLSIEIFSGEPAGSILAAIGGARSGTLIHSGK